MHSRHDRRCYTSDSLTLREGQSRTIAVAMAEHLVMARTYAPDWEHHHHEEHHHHHEGCSCSSEETEPKPPSKAKPSPDTFAVWANKEYEGEQLESALHAWAKSEYKRVADHDHLVWPTEESVPEEVKVLAEKLGVRLSYGSNYRGAAHNRCNREFTTSQCKPVCLFHNLTGYDAHHLIFHAMSPEVEKDGKKRSDFSGIAINSQKLLSFTMGGIEFKDSLGFLGAGVGTLGRDLAKDAKNNLKHTRAAMGDLPETRGVTDEPTVERALGCVMGKGIWPYTWFDERAKFAVTELPPLKAFEGNVSRNDYKRAKEVWELFRCKNMKDFHDIYIALDVFIVCDAMQGLREDALEHFHVEPLHFYGVPGLGFNSWLQMLHELYPGLAIELLSEMELLDLWERGKRGGRCDVTMRYMEANNKYLSEGKYDPSSPSTYVKYYDATNLYGYAMCQHLPVGNFRLADPDFDWRSLPDDGPTGAQLLVDVEIPAELHDYFNYYPPLAEARVTPTFDMFGEYQREAWGSEANKDKKASPTLLATLLKKENYSIHYRLLKEVESLGVKVTKVHKVNLFEQAPIMKGYIEKCTMMRSAATSGRMRDFFKLMVNSIYGKMVQSVRGEEPSLQWGDGDERGRQPAGHQQAGGQDAVRHPHPHRSGHAGSVQAAHAAVLLQVRDALVGAREGEDDVRPHHQRGHPRLHEGRDRDTGYHQVRGAEAQGVQLHRGARSVEGGEPEGRAALRRDHSCEGHGQGAHEDTRGPRPAGRPPRPSPRQRGRGSATDLLRRLQEGSGRGGEAEDRGVQPDCLEEPQAHNTEGGQEGLLLDEHQALPDRGTRSRLVCVRTQGYS